MNLYIAVLRSDKRRGRRVRLAVHAPTRKVAHAMVASRYAKWTLEHLVRATGRHCIAFLDEFPA